MDNSTKRHANRGRRRPVNFVLREEDCDGLISFLETLHYGAESKLMRAVLIEWFRAQMVPHGESASAAANEMIQKYEIIFLQQKRGVQFTDRDHQLRGRAIELDTVRISTQQAEGALSSETNRVAMNAVMAHVESWTEPEAVTETPVQVLESQSPLKQEGTPPALAHVSGEVNVDDILGL